MNLSVQPLQNVGTISGVSTLPKQPTLALAKPTVQPSLKVGPVAPQPQITSIGTATQQTPYTPKLSLDEFAQSIKQKYPEYADRDNTALANAMLQKYPQYVDKVNTPETPQINQQDSDKQTLSPADYSRKYDAPGTATLKGLWYDIIKPTVVDTPKAILGIAGKGLASAARSLQATPDIFTGNFNKAAETMAKPVLGQKTLGGSTNAENVGTALTAASLLPFGKAVGEAAEGIVRSGILPKIFTPGSVGGALGGLGGYLENSQNPTFGGGLKATALGALTGRTGEAITPAILAPKQFASELKQNLSPKNVVQNIKSLNPLSSDVQSSLVRAIKPGKNNTNFTSDLQQALPFIKEAESKVGKISDLDSLDNGITQSKKDMWKVYEEVLGPNKKATIDGNKIADEMVSALDQRFISQNPNAAEAIIKKANTYRRKLTLGEAEEFLQSANNDLSSYYAKNKVKQNIAAKDPEKGYVVKEADALRKTLYEKLDSLTGADTAKIKKIYGALSNIQNEVIGRKNVAARQAPISLGQQISRISAVGDIAKSALNLNLGDAAAGTAKLFLGNKMRQLNDSNYLINQAFESYQGPKPVVPKGVVQEKLPAKPPMLKGPRKPTDMIKNNAERKMLIENAVKKRATQATRNPSDTIRSNKEIQGIVDEQLALRRFKR